MLRSILDLFRGTSASRKCKTNRKAPPRRAWLEIEALETREVPSATVPGYTLTSGNLYNSAISQSPIATNVQTFAVGANNEVFYLGTTGALYAFYQNQPILLQASNVKSFALGTGNEVFYLGTNSDIYAFYQNQPILLQASNVKSFALGTGNEVFYLGTNSDIYAFYQNQPILLQASNVESFALGTGNEVFYLGTNSDIYAFYQNQPILLQASNVESFALGTSNEVLYLGTNGDLYAFYQYQRIESANNLFVSDGVNEGFIYNGYLCDVTPYYQALGSPSAIALSPAEYATIPTHGLQVTQLVPVENSDFALLSNGNLIYWNAGSWAGTPYGSVAWVAADNNGANALAGLTGGGLSYYTVSTGTWGSANNVFVRVGDTSAPDYGAISLIYNGTLVGISSPLWQALGTPQASCIEVSDAAYHLIPAGPQVTSFASVNGSASVFVLLNNGNLLFWNAGGWCLSQTNVAWFAPANGGANLLVDQSNGSMGYYTVSTNTWGSANNLFVSDGVNEGFIYNGYLCDVTPYYQALRSPSAIALSPAEYATIPTHGLKVTQLVPVENSDFALLSNGNLIYWNAGSWAGTPYGSVAWVAADNNGANALAGLTGGGLSYYTVSTGTWGSANNVFVRVGDTSAPDYGAISLIYNGTLVGITSPLWQALGTPQASCIEVSDAAYHLIPAGPQVTSFASVNGSANVFVLLNNGNLLFWNAGGWCLSQSNVAWFAPANGGANLLVDQSNGSLGYYAVSTNTWGSANNLFVRNQEGAISLIYNGSLCGISSALWQALGNPAPSFIQLNDSQYNSIPVGVQMSWFAAVNNGSNVLVLLSNGDLIYWNARSWSLSLHSVTAHAVALDGIIYFLSNGTLYSHQDGDGGVQQVSLANLSGSLTFNQQGSANIAVTGSADGKVTLQGQPVWLNASALRASITLSGLPTQAGTFGNIVVSWSVPGISWAVVSKTYSLVVHLAISPTTVPAGIAGLAYQATLSARGGSGQYTFALLSGGLPSGLLLSSAGVIYGTTISIGSYSFTVQATDKANPSVSGTQAYTVTVNPGQAVSFTVSAPGTATVGSGISVTITAKDAYGHVATGFNGAATLTGNGQSEPVSVRNGTATVPFTPNHSGTITLHASAGNLSGVSNAINVAPSLYYWTIKEVVDYYTDDDGDSSTRLTTQTVTAANAATAESELDVAFKQYLDDNGYDWFGLPSFTVLSQQAAN